jgi:hypothetical protein
MRAEAAIVVCLGVALFALLALLGDRQFSSWDRIPIHWGFNGKPNGYASRIVGLAMFPVIGILVLVALALAHVPVFLLAALLLALVAGNLIYFKAVARALANAFETD